MSFIEVNPLAGLNPITSDLPILCKLNGVSYQEIISEMLKSAIKRNFNNE
jgi:D-alanine-D-alanine ligase